VTLKINRIAFLLLCAAALVYAGDITDVWIVEELGQESENVPITFAQVFVRGDIPTGLSVVAMSSGVLLKTQVDIKSRHTDGSLKHAIITVLLPKLHAHESKRLRLAASTPSEGAPLVHDDLLNRDYDLTVMLRLGGREYHASARKLLQQTTGDEKWLSGHLTTEWHVSSPFKDEQGREHPHLAARFYIRAFAGQKVRTSVIVENNWTFVPNPSGFKYDVVIESNGEILYSRNGLEHGHHARWRLVFWSGGRQEYSQRFVAEYLVRTKCIPNYDRSIKLSGSAFSSLTVQFEPMSNADISDYMPTTGAQPGIGPLPRWAALYLLSMDSRAYKSTLVNGDAAASYQIHYRDEETGLPVALKDHPYMTWQGDYQKTFNPETGEYEAFPEVSNPLTPYAPDDAHQPSLSFLPYLITGDYYYLEELHFWTTWNMLKPNPDYRGYEKGLLHWGQVRAQAWSLRTLAHAAYITPDDHPLKQYFEFMLDENIKDYLQRTVFNPQVNTLGYLQEGHYIVDSPWRMAGWEDDFFTWAVGYVVDLGYTSALPLLEWKSRFILGRMATNEFCWLHASNYTIQVSTEEGEPYTSFAELYQANYSDHSCQGVLMDGYPTEPVGYGANMQPGLAKVIDYGLPGANLAWQRYSSRNPKQDFSADPQFAIIPLGETTIGALLPPVINPDGGTFEDSVLVTLTSFDGADIYYTLNGAPPNQESTRYNDPIRLASSRVVKAVAKQTGRETSEVSFAAFTIVADHTPPTLRSAEMIQSPPSVLVAFSEKVAKRSAEDVANYRIEPSATVLSTSLYESGDKVNLLTTPLDSDVQYLLYVSNVQDLATNPNTIAANSNITIKPVASDNAASRLIALYTFSERGGRLVRDVSGFEPPMNLEIADIDRVSWGEQFLAVTAPTIVLAATSAKIINHCQATNELTLEAWIKPLSIDQTGPARIATLSTNPYERNFTLGQEVKAFEMRLRTSSSDVNGMGNNVRAEDAVSNALTHIVYTRAATGKAELYINGVLSSQRTDIDGSFSNWGLFQFALANELDGSRPWLGELHLIALYDQDLNSRTVQQLFDAGPDADEARQPGDTSDDAELGFIVEQNFPNPFNTLTNICFLLPEAAHVTATVSTLQGREIETLISAMLDAGFHVVVFNASPHASGLYFYQITAKTESGSILQKTKKMLVIK